MIRMLTLLAVGLLLPTGVRAGELVERVVNYTADGKPIIGHVYQAGKSHKRSSRNRLIRRVYHPVRSSGYRCRVPVRYRAQRVVRIARPVRCR